jgi:hypothetical protein
VSERIHLEDVLRQLNAMDGELLALIRSVTNDLEATKRELAELRRQVEAQRANSWRPAQ